MSVEEELIIRRPQYAFQFRFNSFFKQNFTLWIDEPEFFFQLQDTELSLLIPVNVLESLQIVLVNFENSLFRFHAVHNQVVSRSQKHVI